MANLQGTARRRKLTPIGKQWHEGLYVPEMKVPEHNVTALLYYDDPPTKQEIIQHVQEKIWRLCRFSCVIQGNYFVPVQTMDANYHVRERHFEQEADLDLYMKDVMTEPLDADKPRWRLELCTTKKGRSAVMMKVAHSLSDGLGLLFAFLPLMECEDGEVLSKIPLPGVLLGEAGKKAPSGKKKADGSISKKPGLLSRLFNGVKLFVQGILVVLVTPQDSELKINPPLKERLPFLPFSGRHVFTRMPAVPTSDIKAVRSAHSCTFNDAVMAALSGAIRRYSIEKLDDPLVKSGESIECKCTMLLGLPRPVDLKDPGVSLANNIVTPIFRLPVDEATPVRRLKRAVERCNQLKSPAYVMGIKWTFSMLAAIVPKFLSTKVASQVMSSLTMNVTNLPLTEVPIKFMGHELKEVQFTFVNCMPQVSMLSYNGALHWNMISDPALISEPALLGRFFKEEFAAMNTKESL